MYENGAPVSESPSFTAATYGLSLEESLQIGNAQVGPVSGSLSDVRFYNRALSDTEVDQVFERPRL